VKAQAETITPELKVTRTWTLAEPEWPQVAVLQMSGEAEKEFHRDPKAFVNKHRIFPQAVQSMSACLQIGPKGTSGCCATVIHRRSSAGG